MPKFEYKKIPFTKLKEEHYIQLDITKLNLLGLEGWELVIITGGEYIFKRHLEE